MLYGADEDADGLATIDRSTATPSGVGLFGVVENISGLAYDSVTDTLFGIGTTNVVVDQTTGAATPVGAHGVDLVEGGITTEIGLAFDGETGALYAAGAGGDLYTINRVTGAASLVGPLVHEGRRMTREYYVTELTHDLHMGDAQPRFLTTVGVDRGWPL